MSQGIDEDDATIIDAPPTAPPPTAPPPTAHPPPPLARVRPTMMPATLTPGAGSVAGSGPVPHIAPPDDIIGQELCGYAIRRKLAEGGMGVVYEGAHGKIGRLGAIKVLRPELCRAEDVVERFYQEARAVNSIRHDNIVDVYDFGRDRHGRVFFVMEYLEGEPLAARIRRGALPWAEAFPILEQTLRALKAAHDKGFVHRDLKPDNIWLRPLDGRIQVKLLDFGIAKLIGDDAAGERLTQTGSVVGTPHYMSPEQINGSRAIDQRTDLYALGVIAYEMFAGVTPFVGDTLQAIMTGHLFREPPRLAGIPAALGVPPALPDVVGRMLVKNAAGRYDSASDVLADLHDVNQGRPPGHAAALERMQLVREPDAPGPRPQPRRRTRAIAVGAVVTVAIAIAGIAIATSRPDAPAAPATALPGPAPAPAVAPAPVSPPPAPRPRDDAELRGDAQATLRAALHEAEPAVRRQGSDALGKVKDRAAQPALTALTERDPDGEVRGHAAAALGAIGAGEAAPLLARLETAAPRPLRVWYASALARLGDRSAGKRLLGYARSRDLAVAFPAGLALAEVSRPGDRSAIAALVALARHEAQLAEVQPYAGAVLLTRLAALRDPRARTLLYATLDHTDEGARLAAAEGLARLGDDAGRKVLADAVANQASPNRLVAAVAQIPLGEYGGLDVITAALAAGDPATRRLAARGLGEIGERRSLPALVALAATGDWSVRIAAAAAVVAIVGLDPQVLAQASVDWTRGALESQDWAVRKAAAGVLADIPQSQAVPLLAQAIADPDPGVRLAASRSAARMKSAHAAAKVVAAAARAEADPAVKEQQVVALGAIGSPEAHDALLEIAHAPGRIGVIAAGSLIAVGDASGEAMLESAAAAREVELRLAAMHAARATTNPIVMPTLRIGVRDRVFAVQFAAAEGLAAFGADKASAVPVLTSALASKDPDLLGRAAAALVRFGERIQDRMQPAQMLDASDPLRRLAAVPIVRALPAAQAAALLRRLIADPDQDVRRAGIDAIGDVFAIDKAAAIKLYKPLVNDADPVVRSKAAGQLSRLVDVPPPPPPPRPPAPPAAPPADARLPAVQRALDDATAAATAATEGTAAFEALAGELATTIAAPPRSDATLGRVGELATRLDRAAAALETAAASLEAAATTAADAAGARPSPDAARLVDDARARARTARDAATAARDRAGKLAGKARHYITIETGDPAQFIASADAAIAAGDFADGQRQLDIARNLLRKSGASTASLTYSYAQLYDRKAARTTDPAARRALLQQAIDAYRRFARAGGPRTRLADERATELADELKLLPP